MEDERHVADAPAVAACAPGTLTRMLTDDHRRLDGLLLRVVARPGDIDQAAYAELRRGLLRHIGMEEKILLPAAQRVRGGEPLPVAARLRLDHGALAALLVPSPTPGIVAALRAILSRHNAVEEGPDGVYANCERLAADGRDELLAALRTAPEVPVAAHLDGPRVLVSARRALARAGYDLADYETEAR